MPCAGNDETAFADYLLKSLGTGAFWLYIIRDPT